tara:strand:+ start:1000 stop:1230 length:231 start_codon:yes stop_codon:yes gene_type:complete
MSLLKDLNPEVRKAMDDDKKKYPSTYKSLVDDMQSQYIVGDIKVGTASSLISYAESIDFNFESQHFILRLYQIFGK